MSITLVKTERITLTIGVTPGYGHDNEAAHDETRALKAVVEQAIAIACEIAKEIQVFPSFVAAPSRTGYDHAWGCPEGGEFTVVLTGERNPQFCQHPDLYLTAWQMLAERLQKALQQTTCTLVRQAVELQYLKG
jgi:hypothetical protein